ncbi:leucine-rich repeat and calponin homology domain-containing protein 1-like isoform X1 [Anguilla anguilla]|uniref:leucine-rich repeat and calponin homology domain-containing protein 1-like isoform X1 n=1 Tax=Anguilla anguilla TaxID=7936 RepID=UPI0015AB967E|nr:leucine-rich repeat and calponin homology domain-containing protein 1-like isoform X1 [Anguilla anguilla]
MATLGPDSRPNSQLASGSVQTSSSLGSHSNMPLNRGLERALEEAANSGILNLSARKLKEFPVTAPKHDLSDTVDADLSRNRLTDIPSEVCHFVALENLSLYHNCIRTIPDIIINLQSLTSLDLSRNQISALPACLCELPLRVLNASNNKLGALPEAIGQLRDLMELDVSCNEITALPRHIRRLRALRELNVRRNFLCTLPEDLAELPLVKLDVSCNKVTSVPLCYRKMKQLQSLQLDNNPLHSPPAQICMKGKVHIFKYLSMEACRGDKIADSLYLPVMEGLSHPSSGSTEDIEQIKKQDTDSGVGSDNGDKRLSTTEPSDEDSLSLSMPMSHITEERDLCKEDSSDHISALTALPVDPQPSSVQGMDGEGSEEQMEQSDLTSPFANYIKGRASDFSEPLRIEEDTSWASEQTSQVTEGSEIHVDMISQLKEAVEMLQDPDRLNREPAELSGVQLYPVEMVTSDESLNGQDSIDGQPTIKSQSSDGSLEFQRKRDCILERARLEAQLACQQFEKQVSPQGKEKNSTMSPSSSSAPFGLRPRSAPPSPACSPPCLSPLTQALSADSDPSPCSPDEGSEQSSVFLRNSKSLESSDPQFTMRRKMEQLREELEMMGQLREIIESRLKMVLSEDLGGALMDGVVLCHLANYVHPRSVASIHIPSPAVPKLSMAKCRRNVENFLEACRKLGVPESALCSAYDVLQSNLRPVRNTVHALVALEAVGEGGVGSVGAVTATQAPPPAWQFWDLIGSSLLHLFCLILLFVVYSLSELVS